MDELWMGTISGAVHFPKQNSQGERGPAGTEHTCSAHALDQAPGSPAYTKYDKVERMLHRYIRRTSPTFPEPRYLHQRRDEAKTRRWITLAVVTTFRDELIVSHEDHKHFLWRDWCRPATDHEITETEYEAMKAKAVRVGPIS